MIIAFSFNSTVDISSLPESFDLGKYIKINNVNYEILEPIGFGLGFYNYLILGNRLIGINFQFNKRFDFIDFLKNKSYSNITIDEKEVNIWFEQTSHYVTDYSQEFLAFYLLKSQENIYALTINLDEEIDYEIPSNITDL